MEMNNVPNPGSGAFTRSNVRKNPRQPKSPQQRQAERQNSNSSMLKRALSLSHHADEIPVWIRAIIPSEFEEGPTPWLVGPGLRVEKEQVLACFAQFDHFKRGHFNTKDVNRICNRPENFYLFREVFKNAQESGNDIHISFMQFQSHVQHYCREDEHQLSMQERVYLTLSEPGCSKLGFYFSVFILLAIVMSTTTFCIETMPEYQTVDMDVSCCSDRVLNKVANVTRFLSEHAKLSSDGSGMMCKCEPKPLPIFDKIELFCIVLFSLEYVTRLLFCINLRFGHDLVIWLNLASDERNFPKLRSRMVNLVEFVFSPSNLVDLLAVLPFYLSIMIPGMSTNTRVFRVLRLARVFRVLKMGKYSQGAHLVITVCTKSLGALIMLVVFIVAGSIIFGSAMYMAETDDWRLSATCREGCFFRPTENGLVNEVSPWVDIPFVTFWWAVVTLTTVGYGDFFPTTHAGKVVGALCVIGGVLFLAPPITIIGANFASEYDAVRAENARKLMEDRQKRVQARRELLQKVLDKKETIETLKAKGYRGSFLDANQRDRSSFFDLGDRGKGDGQNDNKRSSFRGSMYGSGLGRRLLGSMYGRRSFGGSGMTEPKKTDDLIQEISMWRDRREDPENAEKDEASAGDSNGHLVQGSEAGDEPKEGGDSAAGKDVHAEGNKIRHMAESEEGNNHHGRGLSIFKEKKGDQGIEEGLVSKRRIDSNESLFGARMTLMASQAALGLGKFMFGDFSKEMDEAPVAGEKLMRYEDSRYETLLTIEKITNMVHDLYEKNHIAELCAEKLLFEMWLVETRVKQGRTISSKFTSLMLKSAMTWIDRSEVMLIEENSLFGKAPVAAAKLDSKAVVTDEKERKEAEAAKEERVTQAMNRRADFAGGVTGAVGKVVLAKLEPLKSAPTLDISADEEKKSEAQAGGDDGDKGELKAAEGADKPPVSFRIEDVAIKALINKQIGANAADGAGEGKADAESLVPKRKKDCDFEVGTKMMAMKWLKLKRAKSKAEDKLLVRNTGPKTTPKKSARLLRKYLFELGSNLYGDVCEGSLEKHGKETLSKQQRKYSVLEKPQSGPAGLGAGSFQGFGRHPMLRSTPESNAVSGEVDDGDGQDQVKQHLEKQALITSQVVKRKQRKRTMRRLSSHM